ncbi:MAG: hypothetical protein LUC98_08635 [Lachnospiraceae bacterium]|nr:hypothetical protein [Lachnospiraceae bacterium]
MANRRMFSLDVVDTDAFLEMPLTTQALYFHLGLHADDDGFVSAPKKVLKMTGCKDDDLRVLISKNYIIPFDSGIIVITNWKENNYLSPDRYKPTRFQKELGLLSENNRVYQLSTNGIPTVNQSGGSWYTQEREGEESREEERKDKSKSAQARRDSASLLNDLLPEYDFSEVMVEALRAWIAYKSERREGYKERGLKALLSQVAARVNEYGEQAVCDLMEECAANGWRGIIWDKLGGAKERNTKDRIADRVKGVDDWV